MRLLFKLGNESFLERLDDGTKFSGYCLSKEDKAESLILFVLGVVDALCRIAVRFADETGCMLSGIVTCSGLSFIGGKTSVGIGGGAAKLPGKV